MSMLSIQWIDGWIDWMDGMVDGWTYINVNRLMESCMAGLMRVLTYC